jgi:DNA-binding MarR family transcriptional regulator
MVEAVDFRDNLSFLLVQVAQQVERSSEAALRELGFTARHYGVMAMLGQPRQMSQRELADLIGVDQTTMVALIDHLEELGYVQRHQDTADRRRHALRLTPAGHAAAEQAATALAACEAGFTQPLSPREREQLRALARRLLA